MFEQVHTGSGRRRIDWTECRQCPNRSVMPALGGWSKLWHTKDISFLSRWWPWPSTAQSE